MLATAIIVFREVLEAALIISIVMAAAKSVANRNKWIGGGVAGGLAGAVLVAAFAGAIASALSGMGLEVFNASVLFLAVAMLGWHNVWMAREGKHMASAATHTGKSIAHGDRPAYVLALISGVAVLREGAETALFIYGISISGSDTVAAMLAGGIMGAVAGIALGIMLYMGLVRIPVKRFFTVTSWMILLLAAGLAAQGAGFLVQANILPPMGTALWDSSSILSEDSFAGKILHTLVGYIERPDGVQVLFYILTIAVIASLMKTYTIPLKKSVAAAIILSLAAISATPAYAYKVRSPIVHYKEMEIEYNGSMTFDKDAAKNNAHKNTLEIGYGILPNWKVELEGELETEHGEDMRYAATAFENYIQLTPQGKYWADVGLFLEYAAERGGPDAIEFGTLLQKETGGIVPSGMVHTLNLLVEKQIGGGRSDDTEFAYAWQSRLRLDPAFEPGIEIYGEVEDIGDAGDTSDQEHRFGPMFAGTYHVPGGPGKFKYELGYLLPLTSAAEDGVARWKLEYEFPF